MTEEKYSFLSFKVFSYNEALNNYADMQRTLREHVSDAYHDAYGAKFYNKHKELLERALGAINVFEYSEKRSGRKQVMFPTDAELKKVDKNLAQVVREAKKATEEFMKIIKEHYFVNNRDEFSDKYGTDVRLNRTLNAAAEKWKLVKQDREHEEKGREFREAQKKLEKKIQPRLDIRERFVKR